MKKFNVIGIMSGTSLDGVDIAACEFSEANGKWNFHIRAAETIPYNDFWFSKLKNAHILSGFELTRLHVDYGRFLGKLAYNFMFSHRFTPAFISSHGHTVFHQPGSGLTLQIGSGAEIAAQTRITTISDFRTLDVALGGQGAPLVPVGDRLLFEDYRFCLNIGGFSNISYEENNRRMAFDIAPSNIILNWLASKTGKSFDENGQVAASGNLIPNLFEQLNHLEYYHKNPPKSLGREWVELEVLPLFEITDYQNADLLRTTVEHIAYQVAKATKHSEAAQILVTGGGAKNKFLIERISALIHHKVIIPDNLIIDYKEALVFAFLGVLRILQQPNCLASVTGATSDSCGGAIYSY
jgi:anhydro-N-acetylmuramic acid kinase